MVSLNTFTAASVLSIALADFAGNVANVISDANILSSAANAWTGDLMGALDIQGHFDPLSEAVVALKGDADGVSQQDVVDNIDSVNNLAGSVAGLLNCLVGKAGDFKSVSVDSIVTGDINGLSKPASEIISKLLAVNSDAGALESVKGNVNALADAFSAAISAFDADKVEFPRA